MLRQVPAQKRLDVPLRRVGNSGLQSQPGESEMQPKLLLIGIVTSAMAACGGGNQTLPDAQTPRAPMQASMSTPVAMNPPRPIEGRVPPAPTTTNQAAARPP